jgi:hypothetical protein
VCANQRITMWMVRRRIEHPPRRPLKSNKLACFLDKYHNQRRPDRGVAPPWCMNETGHASFSIGRCRTTSRIRTGRKEESTVVVDTGRHFIDWDEARLTTAWEENEVGCHSGGAGGGGKRSRKGALVASETNGREIASNWRRCSQLQLQHIF